MFIGVVVVTLFNVKIFLISSNLYWVKVYKFLKSWFELENFHFAIFLLRVAECSAADHNVAGQ